MIDATVSAPQSKPVALIEARDFSVTLGPNRLVALKGVNLAIAAGEIVGPSGFGKKNIKNKKYRLLPKNV